ncbi:sodium-independent sulfate anion transporter [Hyalella azteca]|uniref:Sodium-independent sulfate anion transporter n=1 Tax=Hyalella azteca TaxID=294128 RepID=A0A979FRF0_HYAAZ|nr:sodium-independent sulfate anion transporter [Hyalella azteca]
MSSYQEFYGSEDESRDALNRSSSTPFHEIPDLGVGVETGNNRSWQQRLGKSCKPFVKKRVPILQWAPKYNVECLQGDVLAGFTVGLTVIPQGIAYAVVSGVEPTYGLYSSFIGCFVYMLFGSCKDVTIGPTAIMSIMTHEYLKALDCGEGETVGPTQVAVMLTFITGIVILLATVLRIGFLVTFIGRTVISAFTSAAAVTIATSQIKGLLGLSFEAEGFIQTWKAIFQHISETRYQDAVLGIVCCIALLLLKSMRELNAAKPREGDSTKQRILKKAIFFVSVGRNAIIVIISTGIAYGLRESEPFKITGDITAGFPKVSVPSFSVTCNNGTEDLDFTEIASRVSIGLFILPLIAVIENIAIASAFAGGKAIDATQEMLALGLCNVTGSFFQSIPTTGSFSRTAVNATSGVKTQAGGLTTGLLVILALLFLTPAFKYIPKASLSAVIICAVIFMIEYHDVLPIWRTYKLDQVPLWTTFLLCVFWALEWGILVGALVNICVLLYLQATPDVVVSLRETSEGGSSYVTEVRGILNKVILNEIPTAIKNLCKEFSARSQKIAFANMRGHVRTSLLALIPNLEEISLPADPLAQVVVQDTPSVGNSPQPLLSHEHDRPAQASLPVDAPARDTVQGGASEDADARPPEEVPLMASSSDDRPAVIKKADH